MLKKERQVETGPELKTRKELKGTRWYGAKMIVILLAPNQKLTKI